MTFAILIIAIVVFIVVTATLPPPKKEVGDWVYGSVRGFYARKHKVTGDIEIYFTDRWESGDCYEYEFEPLKSV